jgi:DNA mismatch repair protein MutS
MFTRIIGNDNLFRGLSTFAVEMSELRVILNMSNENSLILGDELCSGTETESALSIFVAGLMRLTERKSSFIFATHFHEIVEYDEIKNMTGLSLKHMSVYYDRESDCLVYDRIMKDGSGPRMYGLEVCKSLRMENEFLEIANQLRTKYFKKTQGILSYSPTTYNSKKVRTICEMCKENVASETHHLRHQKDADKEGFIDGSFHKNHVANLMSICEECHLKIHHDENSPSIRKKTTKGYKLM